MLPSYITPYNHTQQREYPLLVKFLRLPLIPIVYILFKDKIDEFEDKIEILQDAISKKSETIESLKKQIREYKEKNNKPELVAEQTKRLVKNGDSVRLEESKVCEGDFNILSDFFSNSRW
jgi:uncharacterized membrane protein